MIIVSAGLLSTAMVKRKRGGFSTSTRTNISTLSTDGILRHSRPTLNQLRADRLATEKQREQLVLGIVVSISPRRC